MKKRILRTFAAIAALLTTVFLTACPANETERIDVCTESALPVVKAEELIQAPVESSVSSAESTESLKKYDFSQGRMVLLATWMQFPDNHSVTYILQDVATNVAYMVITGNDIRSGYTITPLYNYDSSVLTLGQ